MVTIYVLRCEKGKYYVGQTENLEVRLDQHFNAGAGSAWTKKYPPINVEMTYQDCDRFDEDKFTLSMMEKHGIDNVRGGSFCRITLDEADKKMIEKMIRGATGKCFHCGSPEHFSTKCPVPKESTLCSLFRSLITLISGYEDMSEDDGPGACFRCGRHGHWIAECYAKTHKNGTPL